MPQSLSNVLLQIGLNDWCLKEMRQRKDFSSPHEPALKGLQTKLSDALKQKQNHARTHTHTRTLSAPTHAPRLYLTNNTHAHTHEYTNEFTQNKGSPRMCWNNQSFYFHISLCVDCIQPSRHLLLSDTDKTHLTAYTCKTVVCCIHTYCHH